ncbi:hypothetical protein NP493_718g03033 [Ridgeia piscesae]|uniref:Cytochrome P450 n=1 Tax=Ridgeia piscesae TaxID=27915 RepID=A0AAD9NME2_RIDPI|nr:hypothetical protein NP493_718g03033 [Ridgeia piscesae]
MGRDPAYFPEPLRFLPDRWLRDGEDYDDDLARRRQLISGLPFGHGSRMCIGRRFAEQELYLILAKLVQNFRIEYIGKTPEPVLNTVLTPDRPLKFTITPRPERLT